jgi:hypothetical protein
MKKNTIIAVAVIAGLAATAIWYFADGQFIPARQAVAGEMIDPSAAQFRRLRRVGNAVCGEVNSKNRYGAYVGFVEFVYEQSATPRRRCGFGRKWRATPWARWLT